MKLECEKKILTKVIPLENKHFREFFSHYYRKEFGADIKNATLVFDFDSKYNKNNFYYGVRRLKKASSYNWGKIKNILLDHYHLNGRNRF